VFGDASLWYLIADANGLRSDADLRPGATLTIPNQIANVHNSASTFKPYDPGELLGDTSPTLPTPAPPKPKKHGNKCGGMGGAIVIVVAVVAVVVAWYTQRWDLLIEFAKSYGAMANAVVAGVSAAAGSIASQVVARKMGLQDGFSWKQVAISAFTAGATQGIVGDGKGMNPVVYGAEKSLVGQGVAIFINPQTPFSWKSVAIAAIVEPINQSVVGDPQAANKFSDRFASNLGRQFIATAITTEVSIAVYDKGQFNFANVAADAFGNALGNSIVGQMKYNEQGNKTQELNDALKELDVVKENAKAVKDALSDPQKITELRSKGFDPDKLRATYVADLVSGDVYLDPKSKEPDNADKIALMKEALGYFGVSRLSDEQLTALKLDPAKFVNDKSGYYAALYKDDVTGGYLLANRGTESLTDLRADLVNNFAGVDAQFKQAVDLARIVSLNETVGANVTFTGHSLGGALASAQAARVSGNAITFNAAGLTQRVADKLELDLSDNNRAKVEANYLQGDLVSSLQDNPLFDGLAAVIGTPVKYGVQAIGLLTGQIKPSEMNLTIGYVPEAFGTRHAIQPADSSWSPLTRHFNNSVLQSLTNQYLSAATAQGGH
jgi:hypothetical protein